MVEIEGVVSEYVSNAMTDYYESGAIKIFDATRIRVLSPDHLSGRELVFFHDTRVAQDSLWCKIDAHVGFMLDEQNLSEGTQMFAGAAQNFQIIDEA
jgi:hypothetical protein